MRRVRNRIFFLSDLLLLPVAAVLAYVIRFEGANWSPETSDSLVRFVVASLPLKLHILDALGM